LAPLFSNFWCKGTENIKAHRSSSAAANVIFATTEKTKGFSPNGKNPYIKILYFSVTQTGFHP
jgi:hypothetical protein